MSAIRLPLLCAFAGGCLSNALLFGVWRLAQGAGAPPQSPAHRADRVVELAAPAAPSAPSPSAARIPSATEPDHDVRVTATAPAPDLDGAGPAPAGSAVSEVLMGLEAAYRERMAARSPVPAQPSATQARGSSAEPSDKAIASEPLGAAPAAAPIAAAPIEPAPVAPVVVAPPPPAPPTPPTMTSVAPAPAAVAAVSPAPDPVAPAAAAVPALATEDAPRPTEVHYGDVNQNTYITNVRQGDVYLIQLQQLAMLQYVQQLALTSGAAAPMRHAVGAGKRSAFPSGITNPDNPWGFHFAPLNLVR